MPEIPAGVNGHVYIVSARRTPIGKFGGALSCVPATELGGIAIKAVVGRAGLPGGTPIDEVLIGQVLQAGAGLAPARQAALAARLPDTTSATTINRVCGSGLKAIRSRMNVNGGAIALGHPIAASGARIVATLLHELARRQGRFGLATLCLGGGGSVAMALERVAV